MNLSPACGRTPLSPFLMSAAERRAELCRILALGLVRLRLRDTHELSDDVAESSLHCLPNQSAHATPTHRRPA